MFLHVNKRILCSKLIITSLFKNEVLIYFIYLFLQFINLSVAFFHHWIFYTLINVFLCLVSQKTRTKKKIQGLGFESMLKLEMTMLILL